MNRSTPALALALVLLATSAACKKDEAPPAPGAGEPASGAAPAEGAAGSEVKPRPMRAITEPGAGDAAKGSCEVTVSGDVQLTATSPGGPSAVGTDYWMTPEELDKAVEMMVGVLQKDKDKAAADIEKAKKNEPKIMLLLVNCTSEKLHITLGPGQDSKYKDVPFAPGKYKIAKKAGPGEFSVMFQAEGNFYTAGEGTLDITKFDASGIAGTFEFPAEHSDYQTRATKKVTVKGKFDFPCATASAACKR